MGNEVYILFECDAWHTKATKNILGLYKSEKKCIRELKSTFGEKLSKEQIYNLETIKQTQGLETNFIIESWYVK